MTRQEVMKKLNDVFREVFDNEDIFVSESTTSADVKGWDSLMNITLIAEIEDVFDIHFAMADVTGMKSVGEIATKIMELM